MLHSTLKEACGVVSTLAASVEITKPKPMKASFCSQESSFFETNMIVKDGHCQKKKNVIEFEVTKNILLSSVEN